MTSKTIITASLVATVALIALTLSVPANADMQREQVKANFQAADVNQDGQLDIAEFMTFINFNADHNLGQAPMIRRFRMYTKSFGTADANGDGVVSKEEIAARAQQ